MQSKLLLYLISLVYLMLSGVYLSAQGTLTTPSVFPANPLECTSTEVTINGTLPCGNATINGSSHSIVGNTVFVDVFITQPLICLPIILPFSQVEIVGNIPAGTYTLTTRMYVNGVQTTSNNSSLTVGTCCSVDAGFTASSTLICPGDSITFTANIDSLVSYEYKLDGVTIAQMDSATQTFSQAGTYVVSLVGDNGVCIDSTAQTIVVSSFPQISFAQLIDESCPNRNDGAIDLQVAGGTGSFTYLWSNGATTEDISQLMGGSYSVQVTDGAGCNSVDSVNLQTGPDVQASFALSDSLICPGDTVNLNSTSTGATNYTWLIDSQPFAFLANAKLALNDTGTYTFTLIAQGGTCIDTATSATATVSVPPQISPTFLMPSCPEAFNGGIDLQVLGGISPYQYSWSTGDTTKDISQIGAGSYHVLVSDSLGCTIGDTLDLMALGGITAEYMASDTSRLFCVGDSLILTNTSTASTLVAWYQDDMFIGQAQQAVFHFDTSGSVLLRLAVSDSACTDTAMLTVNVSAPPTVTAAITDQTCPDTLTGAIDLNISDGVAPYFVLWSNDSTNEDLDSLAAGPYNFILEDAAGCVVEDSFEVELLGGLEANFGYWSTGPDIQFTDLSDSTAVQWLWDFGDGDSSVDQSPLYTYDLDGGYIVCLTVTDAFGCAATACDTVQVTKSEVGIASSTSIPLKIYPNPANDRVKIEIPNFHAKLFSFRLADAQGRILIQRKMTLQQDWEIEVSHLPEGLYHVYLFVEDKYFMGSFIKLGH